MMERDRWKQIEQLYHAALELEPDAREAFFDEACAGDEALRREVAALLACDIPSDSSSSRLPSKSRPERWPPIRSSKLRPNRTRV